MGAEVSKRSNLEDCLSRVTELTYQNRLQLSNDKTKFIVFASERQKRHNIISTDISVDGIKLKAAGDMEYVDMWLDTFITI